MRFRVWGLALSVVLYQALFVTLLAQAPGGDGQAAPAGGRGGARGGGNRLGEALPIDGAAADRGATTFRTACGFCHGIDARGASGPDLVRSLYVIGDTTGQQLSAFLRRGSPAAGMPAFPNLADADVRDLSMFLRRRADDSSARPGLNPASVVVGDAQKGAAYFNGEGRCSTCHSPTGDLRGVGARYNPMVLQGRMISPRAVAPGRGAPPRPLPTPKVRVTLPTGRVLTGDLVGVDDFFVTFTDAAGQRQTIQRDNDVPKVEIADPLEAHRQQMLKYTDEIMHNLTAYLVTLK